MRCGASSECTFTQPISKPARRPRYIHDRRAGDDARRGMSDVAAHFCAYDSHYAVDNISINCGYAKGMRRSLIRGYSFLQLILHTNQTGGATSGSRVPRPSGPHASASPWPGARARTRVDGRERVGTPVFTVGRAPRRDDASLIVMVHPRRAAARGSHDRGTGPRARRDRRGAHQRRRGAHQRHHTRTAQSESYVVT